MSIDNPTGGGSGTVTSVIAGTGLSGGTITSTGTISLPATAVTPGSYTSTNLTVDAEGRITAAANGSGGGGTHGAYYNNTSAAAAVNSTTTYLMAGLKGSITPARSGNVLITISGTIYGSTSTVAGHGIFYQIAYGTGTAPNNGNAATGTVASLAQIYTSPSTAVSTDTFIPFSISAVVSGLTLSTAYWFDLQQAGAIASNLFQLTSLNITAVELP